MFTRRSASQQRETPEAVLQAALESAPHGPVDWASVFAGAERACCCSARPAVVAVFPARPGRPDPVDLLLCGHHYRECRAGLEAAGAVAHCLPRH